MMDHTYSMISKPAAGLGTEDSAYSSLFSNSDDSTFNTNNLFENIEEENKFENIYSDCDDSIRDPDYMPPFQTLEVSCTEHDSFEEFIGTPNVVNEEQDILVLPNVDEDFPVEGGTAGLRKRRMTGHEKHDQNIKLREIKNQNQMNKHPFIQKTCTGKCKRQCNLLSHENQASIWSDFWKLNYTERRKYMSKCINLAPIKRRKVNVDDNNNFKKNKSRLYTLTHPELKVEIAVCKSTFLQTLGYTNDSVVTELVAVMEKDLCGKFVKENRGRPRIDVIDRQNIIDHINSYHPCVTHYRRHNAPNIRYLPRELTIQIMFDDFTTKFPNYCDLETYRTTLKRQNISLNKPKSDDCEDCLILNQDITNPELNSTLVLHKIKASKANAEYLKDSQEQELGSTRYFSMDLQKVILIPYMPNIKSSYFLSRLVVFNETFATIKKKSTFDSYCVIWHEALSGRKAECITDSIMAVIKKERDVLKFVLWSDNCTAQNKNWTLYSALITAVNQSDGPNEIIIKYLTKGHTHMSADGIHGNIESKMRKKGKIYDFDDLTDTVAASRKKVKVLKLETFYQWDNKKRTTKKIDDPLFKFKLINIVMVRFVKGSNCLEYKNDFDDDLIKLDFLKKSTLRNINCLPTHEDSKRGIKTSKKRDILKTLVPLMPENRRHFWQDLPESNDATDLLHEEDYGLSNSLVI